MSIFSTTAFADGSEPPNEGPSKTEPTDPNRGLSPEEIELRNAKYSTLQEFIESNEVSGFGSIPASLTLTVGTWKQPNTSAYVNHCGPGATQVALDARWAATKVYGIYKIGVDEKTNVGGKGTAMYDIYTTINSNAYLGSEFPNPNGMQGYWLDLAQSASDLFYKITFDITHGYALITGVNTKGMPGWGTRTVPHIVSVIGYNFTPTNVLYVTYIDTSTPTAGFNGSYRNTVSNNNFFDYVKRLNTLVW